MSDRYFIAPPIQSDRAILAGAEAHHAIHVKRSKPGDRLVLFDGSGAEFPARVVRVGRGEVELAVVGRAEVDRELPIQLILGVALPKGERQRWLVEKAVELGVGRIVPLVTRRSVARATASTLARLRRAVIEASKQCGRNRLAEVAEPRDWAEFVAAAAGPCRLLAHRSVEPRGPDPGAPASPPLEIPRSGSTLLAVGPEGGLTSDEVALATSAGWQPIDLGPRTLRIETAAVLLVAIVTQRLS